MSAQPETVQATGDRAGSTAARLAGRALEIVGAVLAFAGRALFARLRGRQPAGGAALAAFFESLGPSFIKLGQLLALHAHRLPPAESAGLRGLYDRTAAVPFAVVEAVLRQELGQARSCLVSIEPEPLASASIGQVHRGILDDGTKVAVKVRKPGTAAAFERDFGVLRRLARWLPLHLAFGLPRGHLRGLIDEAEEFTRRELDYAAEADAIERFAALRIPGTYAPRVFRRVSSGGVLTTELLEGITVNEILSHLDDPDWLAARDVDRETLARRILRNQMLQTLVHGFFQADPHPANLILLPDGRLGYVDFGLVGELEPAVRRDIVDLVMCELLDDYEGLWPILLRYARPARDSNLELFKREFRELSQGFKRGDRAEFAGRSLGVYIERQLQLYRRHRLVHRGRWATYLRSVLVYGHMIALLSCDLDVTRETLKVYWRIKLHWLLSPGGEGGDGWLEMLRHAHFFLRRFRGAGAPAWPEPSASWAEKKVFAGRRAELQALVWLVLGTLATWVAVTLRGVTLAGPLSWPLAAGAAALVCFWRLAVSLRRQG